MIKLNNVNFTFVYLFIYYFFYVQPIAPVDFHDGGQLVGFSPLVAQASILYSCAILAWLVTSENQKHK